MTKLEIVYLIILVFLTFMAAKTWFDFILSEIENIKEGEEDDE